RLCPPAAPSAASGCGRRSQAPRGWSVERGEALPIARQDPAAGFPPERLEQLLRGHVLEAMRVPEGAHHVPEPGAAHVLAQLVEEVRALDIDLLVVAGR